MTVAGQQVGRYHVLGEIGRGAMATVYLARHADLGRDVALKELSSFHSLDDATAARFVRESRLASAISHPNVVTVYDFFHERGLPYIAMEYLPHGSLRPQVGRLTMGQQMGVLDDVLAALEAAAPLEIVHRDLKPENLLLTGSGTVKLSDFGIAKARGALADGGFTTDAGATMGTPEYMAPEQATGGETGPWTDLYAVGVIAYELICGRPPFLRRPGEEPMALMLRHVMEEAPPLSAHAPDADRELEGWVHALLNRDPERRGDSAVDTRRSLDEIASRLLGPSWRREVPPPVAAPLPPRKRAVPTLVPSRGRRRRLAVAAAAGLAAAAGAALGGLSDGGAQETQTLASEGVRLTVPSDWTETGPELAGTRDAVAGRAPNGDRIEAGTGSGHGPDLLPAGLRSRAGDARRVRLGELSALRYTLGTAVLWAIPLERGVLLVSCAPRNATCTNAAASARPRLVRTVALGPTDAYASRLRAALAPLDRRASRVAAARTAAAQARASARLERAAVSALERLGADPPGAWEAAAHARLRSAIGGLTGAAARLAAAADGSDRPALRSARARFEAQLRRLAATRRALAPLGYEP